MQNTAILSAGKHSDPIWKYEVKHMENESIQDKIRTAFINKIQGCTDFNEDEIKQIGRIINSSQNADKIADELYKAIGGAVSENT